MTEMVPFVSRTIAAILEEPAHSDRTVCLISPAGMCSCRAGVRAGDHANGLEDGVPSFRGKDRRCLRAGPPASSQGSMRPGLIYKRRNNF